MFEFNSINKIACLSADDVEALEQKFYTFLPNSGVFELEPSSLKVEVSRDNIKEYIRKTQQTQVNSYKKAFREIKRGFDAVSFHYTYNTLTAKKIEGLVQGEPYVNLAHPRLTLKSLKRSPLTALLLKIILRRITRR